MPLEMLSASATTSVHGVLVPLSDIATPNLPGNRQVARSPA
jgi:hypothetical protein